MGSAATSVFWTGCGLSIDGFAGDGLAGETGGVAGWLSAGGTVAAGRASGEIDLAGVLSGVGAFSSTGSGADSLGCGAATVLGACCGLFSGAMAGVGRLSASGTAVMGCATSGVASAAVLSGAGAFSTAGGEGAFLAAFWVVVAGAVSSRALLGGWVAAGAVFSADGWIAGLTGAVLAAGGGDGSRPGSICSGGNPAACTAAGNRQIRAMASGVGRTSWRSAAKQRVGFSRKGFFMF